MVGWLDDRAGGGVLGRFLMFLTRCSCFVGVLCAYRRLFPSLDLTRGPPYLAQTGGLLLVKPRAACGAIALAETRWAMKRYHRKQCCLQAVFVALVAPDQRNIFRRKRVRYLNAAGIWPQSAGTILESSTSIYSIIGKLYTLGILQTSAV